MAYAPPTYEEIRDALLVVYRNLIPGADISEDSEIYARACIAAAAAAQNSYGVRYVEDQIFPDTADLDGLVRHAACYGIDRLDPTTSSGTLTITGVPATVVAAGLTGIHADGTEYITTSGGVIPGGGSLDVTLDSVTTGSVANKPAGDELEIQSPPIGVDSTATIATDCEGGTDIESQAALLARVLARMQAGNAGGTASDYVQWAEAVDGVLQADCLPLRRGAGTVSVAVYSEGLGGYRAPGDAALRAAVLAALDAARPVTADVDVPVVVEVAQAVTVAILEYEDGYDEAAVRTAVVAAIEAHVYSLVTGETLYRSRLGRAISAVSGVLDYNLTVPAANVTAAVDPTTVEVLVPGVVTVS